MIADIVGYVYCEYTYPHTQGQCLRRAEALLRYTSWRGNSSLCVKSFTSLVPTGWTAWVDREGSCHVRCAEHHYNGYLSDTRNHVKS